jgi:hypothetical protein
MIPSQEHHDKRSTLTKVSISPMGGVVPERDPLVSRNESASATTGDPKPSGSSRELHNSPPTVSYEEVELRYALGGAYAKLELPQRIKAKRPCRGRKGRSKIVRFSPSSRLRLRRKLDSTSRDCGALSITLTYPKWYRTDPRTAKRHNLEPFGKRLERKLGEHACVWRIEFSYKHPHFHLLLLFDGRLTISKARLAEIREFVALAWWEVCGRICEEHRRAGTSVERPRSLFKTKRYISKPERPRKGTSPSDDGPPQDAGRRWGVWRKLLLPIEWVKRRLSIRDAFQLRRLLRKLLGLKHRAGVVTFRVFVRDELIRRLLALLGDTVPG